MRELADKLFYAFCAVMVFLLVAVTYLYSPARDATLLHLGLVVVLVAIASGRLFGILGALASSVAVTIMVALAVSWPSEAPWTHSDSLFTLVALALVGIGCATYVSSLGHRAEQARAAQRDAAASAQLGVGLVPRELDEQALGRLLGSIEMMTGARSITVFSAGESGLAPLPDGRDSEKREGGASETIAKLLDEARQSSDTPQSLGSLITYSDAYIPIVSGSGFEGVMYATRGAEGGQWHEREIGTLRFAAALVGALVERDRLYEQSTHLRAIEESDKLKGSILLSVSHDLKTPLAAATATTSSLIETLRHQDGETLEDLHSIVDDLSTLDWRINELIDLSRLESASWKSNIDWNDPADLCQVVLDGTSERSRPRITCRVAPEAPPFRFDLVQLGRALRHLVENALLYSPSGSSVTVDVTFDEAFVRISVTDQGPGLLPGEKQTVFEKFQRGSAGQGVSHGSGLGLAIASHIVSVHGGTIEVEDVQPTGARFTIVLPRLSEDYSG